MSFARLVPAILLVALPLRAVELKTLKNETIKGDLVSVTAKEIILDTGGGKKVTTPIDQVLNLTFTDMFEALAPETKYALIELTDGTQVKCANYALKGKNATLTLLQGQTVDVPLAQVNWILNEAHLPANLKDFKDKVLARKKNRDMLAVKDKDVFNAIPGTFGDADDKGENIEFLRVVRKDDKDETVRMEVPIARPAALFFLRGANPAAKPVVCRLHDTARNLVFASEVTRTADGISIVTSCGATIKYALPNLARLDYSAGKLSFLSQMPPLTTAETLDGDKDKAYRHVRDANLEGNKIRLGGIEYKSGLAMHATTELVFDLDGEYRELKAMVGIDDDVGGDDEPVVLKIYAEETELLDWTFTRADKQRVRPLNLSIKDVKKLKIVVTSGDALRLDVGKHLTLADARVTK